MMLRPGLKLRVFFYKISENCDITNKTRNDCIYEYTAKQNEITCAAVNYISFCSWRIIL